MSRLIKSSKNGFTLVELLVVIMVIGALAGVLLGVVNSGGVRAKARDAQRKADLKRIQTALELFFADHRTYPINPAACLNWLMIGTGGTCLHNANALSTIYIDTIPVDPMLTATTTNTPCNLGNPVRYRYNYRTFDDGARYVLTAIMEVATSNDDSPCSYTGWGCASHNSDDFCYMVRSP